MNRVNVFIFAGVAMAILCCADYEVHASADETRLYDLLKNLPTWTPDNNNVSLKSVLLWNHIKNLVNWLNEIKTYSRDEYIRKAYNINNQRNLYKNGKSNLYDEPKITIQESEEEVPQYKGNPNSLLKNKAYGNSLNRPGEYFVQRNEPPSQYRTNNYENHNSDENFNNHGARNMETPDQKDYILNDKYDENNSSEEENSRVRFKDVVSDLIAKQKVQKANNVKNNPNNYKELESEDNEYINPNSHQSLENKKLSDITPQNKVLFFPSNSKESEEYHKYLEDEDKSSDNFGKNRNNADEDSDLLLPTSKYRNENNRNSDESSVEDVHPLRNEVKSPTYQTNNDYDRYSSGIVDDSYKPSRYTDDPSIYYNVDKTGNGNNNQNNIINGISFNANDILRSLENLKTVQDNGNNIQTASKKIEPNSYGNTESNNYIRNQISTKNNGALNYNQIPPTVGDLPQYKTIPSPYILPEYRRFASNYDIFDPRYINY